MVTKNAVPLETRRSSGLAPAVAACGGLGAMTGLAPLAGSTACLDGSMGAGRWLSGLSEPGTGEGAGGKPMPEGVAGRTFWLGRAAVRSALPVAAAVADPLGSMSGWVPATHWAAC